MRFTSLLSLACLTAATLAAPVEQAPKGFEVFEKSFSKIQSSLKGLTVAIKDLDTNARRGQDTTKQEQDIERRTTEVTQSLRDGASNIRKAAVLTTIEATSTIVPIEEMGSLTQKTVDAWIQAKPSIVRAGGRQAILKLLAAQETATDEFVDAVQAKMPLVTMTAARIYGQKARNQVDQAIAAFNKQ
ncbi:hypothetical protein BLS_005149 [Venturia inaequalis]|uniref:Cell wall protein n=1 Tax=Venturia inaequalis TaxID=5025 RepID=A0A8H3VSJ9_VENIN|nr:hypothetical protein BLS_005149 [Venturia inaequalis]KAE9992074.1 hypothetical protein EG327_010175 [Venturia inaequalis]RDI79523.1 hypothetical protein Vi05172_g10346 [Venturia inaequalis]